MATALTVPTGAQIMSLFIGRPGSVKSLGTITEAAIDAHVTSEGEASIPNVLFNYVSTLLTNAGYTPAALDDVTEYPYAWRALRWLCVFEFFKVDYQQRSCTVKDATNPFNQADYDERMNRSLQTAVGALAVLGITNTKYFPNTYGDYVDFDTVDRCFDKFYDPNN